MSASTDTSLGTNKKADRMRMLSTLGYCFNNDALLVEALTHRSAAHAVVSGSAVPDNERLEFLGDAVLSLVLSTELLRHDENFGEGALSQIRAALVNEQTLAKLAAEIGLNTCLLLSASEERSGGREKASLLGDAMEALLGAVYLDGGFDLVRQVILGLYQPFFRQSLKTLLRKDYKSRLQELLQNLFKDRPQYQVVEEHGPEHQREFEVQVSFNDRILGQGKGLSKKQASQIAARSALDNLHHNPQLLEKEP